MSSSNFEKRFEITRETFCFTALFISSDVRDSPILFICLPRSGERKDRGRRKKRERKVERKEMIGKANDKEPYFSVRCTIRHGRNDD